MSTLHDFGGVLAQPLGTFIWALAIYGHGSWLMCEVALSILCFMIDIIYNKNLDVEDG